MKTFREKFFKFKRISSKDFGLVVVSIGSDTSPNFFGVERSVRTEDSGGIVPLFKGFDYKCPQITITMTKMDMQFKNLAPITKVDEYNIMQWLYGDEEFHPLQSDDNDEVIYYVACVKAEKYIDDKGDGYITATFQMDSPCAYTPVRHHNYLVRNGNEKIFDIHCKTNVEKFHYPDVEFILTGNNRNVKILINQEYNSCLYTIYNNTLKYKVLKLFYCCFFFLHLRLLFYYYRIITRCYAYTFN